MESWIGYLKKEIFVLGLDEVKSLKLIRHTLEELIKDGWDDRKGILEHLIDNIKEDEKCRNLKP